MFKGIINPVNKEILCGIQLEKKKAGDMYTGYYAGFSDVDDSILSILSISIGMKLCQVKETAIALNKDKLALNILNGINTLITNRSCLSFMISLKDTFPPLLGYEHMEIYLYIKESNCLII